MSPIPVLGYPSKKAAIWALLDEGLSNDVIATKVDCSQQAVYVEVTAKRNHENRMKIGEKRTKALRIYWKALDVIADALDLHAEDIHTSIARLKFGDLETLFALEDRIAEQAALRAELASELVGKINMPQIPASDDEEERGIDQGNFQPQNITENITEPANSLPEREVAEMRNSATSDIPGQLYTLRDFKGGQWLNKSGTSTTRYKDIAYRGTFEQATIARDTSKMAKAMSMRIVKF